MSTTKVLVQRVDAVAPHPNADALELVRVGGWQVVSRIGTFAVGDKAIYFEPGTILPDEVAESFGIKQYMRSKVDINGDRVLVIDKIRLRGEPSYGFAVKLDGVDSSGIDHAAEVLTDLSDHYGARKYMPPQSSYGATHVQNSHPGNPLFPRYTDIENLRNYSNVLDVGQEVVMVEKVHGTNSRVGIVAEEDGTYSILSGSRRLIRGTNPLDTTNIYDLPLKIEGIKRLFVDSARFLTPQSVVVYGELYGPAIQKFGYGTSDIGYVCFDIAINGVYADYDNFCELCRFYDIPMAPEVWRGPFSLEAARNAASGKSLLAPDAPHCREGVVVRPVKERTNPKTGRTILKFVSDEFLFSKAAEASDTTDV